MIGRVVSIVVAPPAEMGARRPKDLTNNGAQSRAIISRMMFDKSAIVPNSGPLYSVKESNNRILRLLPCNRSVNDGSGTG